MNLQNKYNRVVPLFLKGKYHKIILLICIIIEFILVCFCPESLASMLFSAFLICYVYLFAVDSIFFTGQKYLYADKHIEFSIFSIVYKKVEFSEYNNIVISNASYTNGHYHINLNYPMCYKRNKKSIRRTVPFPCLLLLKPNYPINKIKSGMYSNELYYYISNDFCFLGICWFESFAELLEHTDMPVYILEDVYLRFKGKFDEVIKTHSENMERYHIIASESIKYTEYLNIYGTSSHLS